MKKTLLILVTAGMLLAPVAAQAARFVVVGPAFGWGYGPYWGPYPYGFYNGYNYGPATGAVKFDTNVKNAEVYINGAYAGTVAKLKTLHLRPGTYDVELRAPGDIRYSERIYVAPGKTLHLNPEFQPARNGNG